MWPTARFSFRSMRPECCRHAQVSVVTPKRKAPPQHVQTPATVTVTASVGGGGKEKEITSGQAAGAGGYWETQHYQLHDRVADGEVVPLPTGAWPALSQSTAPPGHRRGCWGGRGASFSSFNPHFQRHICFLPSVHFHLLTQAGKALAYQLFRK